MSTATIDAPTTPPVPAPSPGTKKVTLARVTGSEWIKFRSVRSSWFVLLAAAVAMVAIGLAIAYNTRNPAGVADEDAVASATLQGYHLAELLIGVLGALFVTGDYASGMIRSTFAAVPARTPVLLGKAGVLTAVALVTLTVTSLVTFLSSQALISQWRPGFSLSDPTALRAVVGTGVFLTLIGLLGVAFGWLVRSTAGAISALLALLLVLPVVFGQLLGSWGADVAKYLPSTGESFIVSVRDRTMLSPWAGLGVLAAWVAVALTLAAVQLRRRDV
jgi:hypothetical protein